jgi:hypothetical protein
MTRSTKDGDSEVFRYNQKRYKIYRQIKDDDTYFLPQYEIRCELTDLDCVKTRDHCCNQCIVPLLSEEQLKKWRDTE